MTKEIIILEDQETAQDLNRYIIEENPNYDINYQNDSIIYTDDDYNVTIPQKYFDIFNFKKSNQDDYSDQLIFGKNSLQEIISIEVKNDKVFLFLNDGTIKTHPMIYWMLSNKKLDSKFERLEGNQHYKFIRRFKSKNTFIKYNGIYNKMRKDVFRIFNDKESAMIYYGYTMFKGLKVKDVSVLSFDIEASGLTKDKESKVFLITNTFRKSDGSIVKKHFRLDHYNSDIEMIDDWCKWVVKQDPTVINGHNIYGYDLPYLQYCYAERDGYKRTLPLGKYEEPMAIKKNESKFRVDGNQTWSYKKIHIYGRHIIDGMFLAVKYDIGRNYPSWGLKQIAEYEGIVKKDRQFYDASQIGKNWHNKNEREKIVAYGVDDSDDSLALYDIHIPSIFYMTQSVPKPFQLMGLSASGAQLNAIMVRAYMQDNHSIPKTSDREYVAGGMSYGIPGVYKNVVKWDAKSYYPSTILAFDIYDKEKDPKAYFLKMVKYFTYKRFEQKDQYKETGDSYYDDLQAASKVFINSSYGLLGTPGLNFNSYKNAALITKCCRAGLQKAIIWATGFNIDYWWKEYKESTTHEQDFAGFENSTTTPTYPFEYIDNKTKWNCNEMPQHNWKLVNLDTDSLSFCKQDGSVYTKDEKKMIFEELNNIMYSEWEPDGVFEKVLVVKAKNYVLKEEGSDKLKFKGSSLVDGKKELALREMLQELINGLLNGEQNSVNIYHNYIKEANNIKDINRWTTKKSVTAKVLNPERTNELVVLNAIKDKNPREGDKFYLYTALDGKRQKIVKGEPVFLKSGEPSLVPNNILKCAEDWNQDEYKVHYTKRVYMTLCILENLLEMDKFLKFHNKSNQEKIKDLL